MKKRLTPKKSLIILSLMLSLSCSSYANSPHNLLSRSKQLLLVLVPNILQDKATLRFYQRKNLRDKWTLYTINNHSSIPVVIGSSGLALKSRKKEGDNCSPTGVFTISTAFGIKYSPSFMPYIHINPHTICIDDAQSKLYNKIIDKSAFTLRKNWTHAEAMNIAPMYDMGLKIDYNPLNIPGKGSCIFLHQWRTPDSGTAGCTAMDSQSIQYLINTLAPKNHPVLVQLSQKKYLHSLIKWKLPTLPNLTKRLSNH